MPANAETARRKGPERLSLEQKPIDIVRVFPWTVAMADRVAAELECGIEPCLIRVLLGQKSGESFISSNMLTPIGGNRRSKHGETKLDAAFRETEEESTIALLPWINDGKPKEFIHVSSRNFIYTMEPKPNVDFDPAKKSNYEMQRRVALISLPALPPRIMRGHFPHAQKDKLEKIVPLTIDELKHLFEEGEFNGVPIVGHCTKNSQDPIEVRFRPDQLIKRNVQLDSLLNFLRSIDAEIHRTLLRKLNAGHVDDLRGVYQNLQSEVGEEEALHRLRKSLDETRLELYAEHFRNAEFQERETGAKTKDIRKLFSSGNRGIDILHLLPIYTQTETRTARTTHSMVAFGRFMLDLFANVVQDRNLTISDAVNLFLEKDQMTFLAAKVEQAEQLHATSLKWVAQKFGFSEEYVHDVWRETLRFFPDFGRAVRSENPVLQQQIRQAHELKNEVNNAGIPELIVRYLKDPEAIVRFEAGRQLFIFLKILFNRQQYDAIIRQGNTPFKFAVQEFFGRQSQETQQIWIKGRPFPTREGSGYTTLVDEKPVKDIYSYIRKSLEASAEDIHDVFGYSIVNLDHSDEQLDPQAKIRRAETMTATFHDALLTYFPRSKGFRVEITNDSKDKALKLYESFLRGKLSENELNNISGKRTGSKGDAIVRRKIVVNITYPDGQLYKCEFTFYPFAQLDTQSTEAGFMGWEEKIQDDENYVMRRILNPLKGMDPVRETRGLRSLYELFFPSHFYPHVAEWIRKVTAEEGYAP